MTKIGSLIIDLKGVALTPEEKEMIGHPLVGGIILFTRNYESREQIQHLCQAIRAARKRPIIILVDQEGGRVQRFIKNFTRIPCMGAIGQCHDDNPQKAHDLARYCGWLMASELISVGIDLSLAPVLDLNKGMCPAIGDRAFHAHPHTVMQLATTFIQGMREAGMAATGKHFPGHGSVSVDSHVVLPIDTRSLREIEESDMIPFAGLIKTGIQAMMAAHIVFPKVDSLPVGFSRFWLTDVLKTRLAFNGVIFSDDLNMEGANRFASFTDRVEASREAGCDFALLCNNPQGVIQVLDHLSYQHQVDRDKWGLIQGDFSPHPSPPRFQKTGELLKNL